jgi:hypothetical protein
MTRPPVDPRWPQNPNTPISVSEQLRTDPRFSHLRSSGAADRMGIRELAQIVRRQQDQIERMREVFDLLDWKGERVGIQAPEDAAVGALCERWGYGAVMDSAARQWRRKDPSGAFLVGACACIVEGVLAQVERPTGEAASGTAREVTQ